MTKAVVVQEHARTSFGEVGYLRQLTIAVAGTLAVTVSVGSDVSATTLEDGSTVRLTRSRSQIVATPTVNIAEVTPGIALGHVLVSGVERAVEVTP